MKDEGMELTESRGCIHVSKIICDMCGCCSVVFLFGDPRGRRISQSCQLKTFSRRSQFNSPRRDGTFEMNVMVGVLVRYNATDKNITFC